MSCVLFERGKGNLANPLNLLHQRDSDRGAEDVVIFGFNALPLHNGFMALAPWVWQGRG